MIANMPSWGCVVNMRFVSFPGCFPGWPYVFFYATEEPARAIISILGLKQPAQHIRLDVSGRLDDVGRGPFDLKNFRSNGKCRGTHRQLTAVLYQMNRTLVFTIPPSNGESCSHLDSGSISYITQQLALSSVTVSAGTSTENNIDASRFDSGDTIT
jgi:hypothetical protein